MRGAPILRAATRASALARRQTDLVAEALAPHGVVVEPVVVSTAGDRRLDVPVHAIGGKGVFVKEVQATVLEGRADLAVHSAKDLPALTPPGLVLAAVPARADARDVLVGRRWDDLGAGAIVATGSVRRRAQLAWARPHLGFRELRGNIETRLRALDRVDAVVVAAAALDRLGLRPDVVDPLPPWRMLPQVGQGAMAVECRVDDDDARRLLSAIEDPVTRRAVDTERAFLAELGGDCDLPAGAHATVAVDGTIHATGLLAALDGSVVLRHRMAGTAPDPLGRALARHLLDHGGTTLAGSWW